MSNIPKMKAPKMKVSAPQMSVEHTGEGRMIVNLPNGKKIVAESKKTRNGFKHEATLYDRYGSVEDSTKINYLNRTWESYEFQSVINKLVERGGEGTPEVKAFLAKDLTNWAPFKQTAGLMMMGEVLGMGNLKAQNEMKLKALKATMPEILIPEDWATLDEPAKADRLKKIEGLLTEIPHKE